MTIRHTALASVQSIILVTILVTGMMGFGISAPEVFADAASGCEKSQGASDGKTNNPHCEETGSGDGGDTGSGDGGDTSSGGTGESSWCDTNSDGVITAAELLDATGTSIDWQAVIDSVEASLSGSDTNNNGLIDTSTEFAELKRVVGC